MTTLLDANYSNEIKNLLILIIITLVSNQRHLKGMEKLMLLQTSLLQDVTSKLIAGTLNLKVVHPSLA
jgi:hypothetical protein